MKPSLSVARPSAAPTTISREKPGMRSSRPASRSDTGGSFSVTAAGAFWLSTKSTSTARPTTAKQKLTRKIESKASGAMASRPKATSGPIIAPVVSRARCTPKDVAMPSGVLLSEIIASRGAVRMPLPVRSIRTSAPMAEKALPTTSRPSLHTAERP